MPSFSATCAIGFRVAARAISISDGMGVPSLNHGPGARRRLLPCGCPPVRAAARERLRSVRQTDGKSASIFMRWATKYLCREGAPSARVYAQVRCGRALPPPSAGGGWPLRQQGSGRDESRRGEPGFRKRSGRHEGQCAVRHRCSPLPTPFGGHPPPQRGEGEHRAARARHPPDFLALSAAPGASWGCGAPSGVPGSRRCAGRPPGPAPSRRWRSASRSRAGRPSASR